MTDGFEAIPAARADEDDTAIGGAEDFLQGRDGGWGEAECARVGQHGGGGIEDSVDVEEEDGVVLSGF